MDDNNFALFAWIKKDQEERRRHTEKMALKYAEDDKHYLNLIGVLVKLKLSNKEKIFLNSLLSHKKDGRNWSNAQRSAIAGMYYKHVA